MIDVEAGRTYTASAYLKDINPELWGSGGGTGVGTPGAASPMLIDLEALRPNLSDNPNAWSFTSNAGTITHTIDVVDATSPTGRSTRIERTAGDAGWAVFRNEYGGSNVVIRRGDEVRVGFYVKRGPNDLTDGQLHLMLSTSSATNKINPSSHFFTATTSWQWVEMTFTATADAEPGNLVYVSLYHAVNIDTTIDYYFAGAIVEKVVRRALWLPGVVGNYASVPDNPALHITGDLDLRVKVALKDPQRSARDGLIGRWGVTSAFAWTTNTSGMVRLDWYQADGTAKSLQTSVALPAGRDVRYIRGVLDVDNGASGHDWSVYTSLDGVAWTLLQTVTGTGVTSIREGSNPLVVGNFQTSAGTPALGVVLAAQIRDGIDGTIVYDEDFTADRWDGVDTTSHPAVVPASRTAFTRTSTAHLDGVEVASGTPRYPHGRNVLSEALSRSQFDQFYGAGDEAALDKGRTTADAIRVTRGTSTHYSYNYNTGDWNLNNCAGLTVRFSVWAKPEDGTGFGGLSLNCQGGLAPEIGDTDGEWTRLSVTRVVTARHHEGGVAAVGVIVYSSASAPSYLFSDWQIEVVADSTVPASPWRPGGPSAVLVEEGTTNLLAAAEAAGDSGFSSVNMSTSPTYDTAVKWQGTTSVRASVVSGGTSTWRLQAGTRAAVTAGTTYTFSVYVRTSVAHDIQALLDWYDVNGTRVAANWSTAVAVPAAVWTRIVFTLAAPTGATQVTVAAGHANSPTASMDVWLDGLQLEAKGYATSWHPGGATRANEVAKPSTSLINQGVGTIEVDVLTDGYTAKKSGTGFPRIVEWAKTDGGWGLLIYYYQGRWYAGVRGDDSTQYNIASALDVYTTGWHRFSFAWDGTTIWFYIDGNLIGTRTVVWPTTGWSAFCIGNTTGNGALDAANSPFDGIRVSNRARAGTELADYTALLTADDATTYLNTFDGDLSGEWGATTTINRSGGASAEIVDRNTWAFTGGTAEDLLIPDRDDLDMGFSSMEAAFGAFARTHSAGRYVFSKRSGDRGYGMYIQPTSNNTEVNFDSGGGSGGHVHNIGAGTAPSDAWFTFGASWDRAGDKYGYMNGVAGTAQSISDHASIHVSNENAFRVGYYYRGFVAWGVVFRRLLTSAERTELHAWDGTVATEPTWLRTAALLYVNADDPDQRTAYETNQVINLVEVPGRARLEVEWRDGSNNLVLVDDPAPNYRETILKDGPVGYWRLGETSGTTVAAEVGADGAYQNSPTLGLPGALTNDASTSVAFDTSRAQLSAPHSGTNAWTWECWFYPTAGSTSVTDGLFGCLNSPRFCYGNFATGSKKLNFLAGYTDTGSWAFSSPDLTLNEWQHVAVTISGADTATPAGKMYVNGVEVVSSTAARAIVPPGTQNLYIGLRDTAVGVPGRVDEPAAYNFVLTADQVKRHYEAGRAKLRASTSSTLEVPTTSWVRPFVTGVAPAGATQARVRTVLGDATPGREFYADGALFESTSVLKPYFDANFASEDYMWKGTANASPSLYYANRNVKFARLGQVLPTYLPPDRDLTIRFDVE